ncbi:MAG: argininosuccinate lyase [bacterium]
MERKEPSWKAWGGRFEGTINRQMEEFSSSIYIDYRIWREDIAVNKAWAEALVEIGIYTKEEQTKVNRGLDRIAEEFESETFRILESDEDIHVAIERRLTEITGDAGARIHTGRSRNDQVATDTRLFLKRNVKGWVEGLIPLQNSLLSLAEKHINITMPGYTHLQQAQPILLSHHLLAIFWGVDRTLSRLNDYYVRLDVMPLGAGALAGSAFPIDREKLAQRLGFARISQNSIDATGDREFCAELLFIIGAFFTLLSRVCGELQLWSCSEFNFIESSDAYSTGSSMMPQKKNPDAMELIRGKAAAAITATSQILILQKGLPLTYNRDLQEDKFITFRQLDEATIATKIFGEVLCSAKFNMATMQSAIDPLTLATDLADYLVRKDVPFRKAHEIAGSVVRLAIERKTEMTKLPLAVLREINENFEKDVYDVLTVEKSISQRNLDGGTGQLAVKKQIGGAKEKLKEYHVHAFLIRYLSTNSASF